MWNMKALSLLVKKLRLRLIVCSQSRSQLYGQGCFSKLKMPCMTTKNNGICLSINELAIDDDNWKDFLNQR